MSIWFPMSNYMIESYEPNLKLSLLLSTVLVVGIRTTKVRYEQSEDGDAISSFP